MHFLYLTRPEWADAWISGGTVPLALASSYLSAERSGTMTPDEVRQRFQPGGGDGAGVKAVESMVGPGSLVFMRNVTVITAAGMTHEIGFAQTALEDSLILCLSTSLSKGLMRQLGKSCVVAIHDIDALNDTISSQLGTRGRYEEIIYTRGPDRGHRFKGWEDRWQAEARLWWRPDKLEATTVDVPSGTGTAIDLATVPETSINQLIGHDDWYDLQRGYRPAAQVADLATPDRTNRAERRRALKDERKAARKLGRT